MNKNDLRQIGSIIEEKIEPIKKKLGDHDRRFDSISKTLEEGSEKLDSLTLDMIEVQKKTDVLDDIHENTKDIKKKVGDLETRVEVLESVA